MEAKRVLVLQSPRTLRDEILQRRLIPSKNDRKPHISSYASTEDIRLVAVHRLEGIQVLDDAAVCHNGFSLQTYIFEFG